ncbi:MULTISPECIES: hypothetical protein [Weeksellaceae]|uniref:NERD domain-containing protein n=2 Tax=Chryseobacterium TaxID=59732 RepID=A0AAD0YYT9_CHRID|nr:MULTISPECIES: hypothetical protein [Weeksellaceae]ATL44113.1 hypothetical protein CQS02_12815 [Elizabethkingia miricola]AZB19612.1 hypothetical protein EG352_18475 [Chryseobacterium indologenes]MCT3688183.1 hypothetical protein [Elizabethkingia anophelis]MCT3707112.1 hypothetical protein [Elizabethkingia anophelis]MCT3713689.1 hypothetical protein [Elizabethkingia anophelis]
MDDNQIIRNFEKEVLDKSHEKYPFFQYPYNIVIPYILQVYGDTERHRDNLIRQGLNDINFSIFLNNMLHGMGHCIRWIVNRDGSNLKDITTETYQQLHEMAADFLGWGAGYHMIAQEFVTWSRKIKKATVDVVNREITFINPESFDYSKIYDLQVLYASRTALIYESYPHSVMEQEFSEWIKSIDFKKPPIANHIDWKKGRLSISYPLLYSKMKEVLFPELEETTDFEGYNLQQLRQFFALSFLSFYFIRWIEGYLDSGMGENNLSYGSNPLSMSADKFKKLMCQITGLNVELVSSIIKDLTFNPSSFHTSVTIQPFIYSQGEYYILPNLFVQVEPSRMMLGALNKGEKKRVYDKLINSIEKTNLDLIGRKVKQLPNIVCYLEKTLKNNGQRICPDIILIDPTRKFLLVADYKHFIGPISGSEVEYKIKELEKAINQVQKYIDNLNQLSKVELISIQDFTVSGLIITHKPLPVPIPIKNNIPIVDMETFNQLVEDAIFKKMGIYGVTKSINHWYHSEPKNVFSEFESEIIVEDWKVKRTQHKFA